MPGPGTALPPNSIFFCYRRLDSEEMVDRIYETLATEFGTSAIFRDIDTIPPGADFPTYIAESLRGCVVVLVFIGREWATCLDQRGRPRLHDPADHVRIEIETALALSEARVIPIFVRRAPIPAEDDLPESLRPLRRRNGITVRSSGADYRQDIAHLASALRRSVAEVLEKRRQAAEEKQRQSAAERDRLAEEKRREAQEKKREEQANRQEQEQPKTDSGPLPEVTVSDDLKAPPAPIQAEVVPRPLLPAPRPPPSGGFKFPSGLIMLALVGAYFYFVKYRHVDIKLPFMKPTPAPSPLFPPLRLSTPLPLAAMFPSSSDYKLTSITPGLGKLSATAIINGQAYREGDLVDGPVAGLGFGRFRVAKIGDTSVTLQRDDQTLVIKLESLKNVDPYFGQSDASKSLERLREELKTNEQVRSLLAPTSSPPPGSPTPANPFKNWPSSSPSLGEQLKNLKLKYPLLPLPSPTPAASPGFPK